MQLIDLLITAGGGSTPSDVESTEETKVTPSSEDAVSVTTASDVLEDEDGASESPEETPQGDASCDVSVGGAIEAGAGANADTEAPPPASSPELRPLDCVKDIRDLVVEVIEVEELLQRYPDGLPKDD